MAPEMGAGGPHEVPDRVFRRLVKQRGPERGPEGVERGAKRGPGDTSSGGLEKSSYRDR